METFQKYKKVLLFLGIFIVLAFLYWLIFSGRGASPQNSPLSPTAGGLLSESSGVSSSDAIVGNRLLSMLSELKSIHLDAAIFSDAGFAALQDWSRPIEPEPLGKTLGRRNPFSDFDKAAPAAVGAPRASSLGNH